MGNCPLNLIPKRSGKVLARRMTELLPHLHKAATVLLVRGDGRLSNQPFTRAEVVVDEVGLDAKLRTDGEGGERFGAIGRKFGNRCLKDGARVAGVEGMARSLASGTIHSS